MNFDGSMEFVLCAQILAIRFRLKVLTAVSLAKSIAEAPSEIELELAAVTVPPSLNTRASVSEFCLFEHYQVAHLR